MEPRTPGPIMATWCLQISNPMLSHTPTSRQFIILADSENFSLIDRFKPNNLESYADWSLVLLVVQPMPDRSKGRGQQKVILWPSRLGVWHRANNPVKKHTVTETATEDTTTTVCHVLSESPQCMSSLHWNNPTLSRRGYRVPPMVEMPFPEGVLGLTGPSARTTLHWARGSPPSARNTLPYSANTTPHQARGYHVFLVLGLPYTNQ